MKKLFVLITLLVISLLFYGCAATMKSDEYYRSEGMKLACDYRVKEAIPVLEKEIRENPSDSLPELTQEGAQILLAGKRILLAALYNLDNRPQQALSVMQQAVIRCKSKGLDPDAYQIHTCYEVMGLSYLIMREYDKAEKMFKISLQIKESAAAYANLVVVYIELGKFDLAMEQTRACYKIDKETLEKSFKTVSAIQEAGHLELALRNWKRYLYTTRFMPNYIEDEEILNQVLDPERLHYVEQQIEALTIKLEPQTFEESKPGDKFDSYAEQVVKYLAQSGKHWKIVVGDFGTRTVEKTKLGSVLASAITEKLNAEESITVLQDEAEEGTMLYGVVEDCGPIVIVRVHLLSPDGSLAIASPEPLDIANDSEVTELLQSM